MIMKKLIAYGLLFVTISIHANGIELYLDLMEKCVVNSIYQDNSIHPGNTGPYQAYLREDGQDWPQYGHTMIGVKRVKNIRYCVEEVLKNGVEGDLIETGVWRGGACIFMRAILKAYGCTNRNVWLADSFQGLPPPSHNLDLPLNTISCLAVSLETVKENFRRYGLLDDQVKFIKGWFCDTLPRITVEKFAVLRLDGDYYDSTMLALEHLYPKLSKGGFVIIDDYALGACRKAVTDFRNRYRIADPLITIDSMSVYWKKS